jgi:ATP-dependent Lon protease
MQVAVLPLSDAVVLPGMVVPVALDDHEVRAAIEAAQLAGRDNAQVALVPRLDGRYAAIGTLADIEQLGRLPGGQAAAVVRGVDRLKIGTGTTGPGAALWVEAEILPSPASHDPRTLELAREYKTLVISLLQQRGAFQVVDTVSRITDPSELADTSGWAPYLDAPQKLQVLETLDIAERLTLLIGWARAHLAEQEVAETIRKDVSEGMERQQREFLLRQQLAAVRKELRELSGQSEEDDDIRAKVEGADLPDPVRAAALKEVDRLERTSDQSPEGGWIRSWLDTVLEMPWSERTDDAYDVTAARAVLDADHAGLDEVKERITEYLAVRKRRSERGLGVVGGRRSGAVLALVGPPGVGKTSLGESVAKAMGRKFVRVALGGVRDEAEIRGHRRTYVGAMPGRIVRAIKEAGSMNPVILLDEIDKVGSDYRGDPTAALLEVLDPAQNHTFRDHYLELELDLSDVLFLATANVFDSIPGPLLDRMEVVTLDGYTEDEKVTIARDHLLPKQLERAGFEPSDVTFTDEALRTLVATYTREAGVRNLERTIAKVLRKVAARSAADEHTPVIGGTVIGLINGAVIDGSAGDLVIDSSVIDGSVDDGSVIDGSVDDGSVDDLVIDGPAIDIPPPIDSPLVIDSHPAVDQPVVVDVDSLVGYVGRPRHTSEVAMRTAVPGVATGLAVTGAGGDVLFVEASLASEDSGSGGLTLTGQLGDVMKESAQIALSYLRAHGAELGLPVAALRDRNVHIHVPAGAVPKDGPSAGVTLTTALASLLSGRPVRTEVAMTGEVSLTGRVLPIGGLKQKLLAADRAGITTVLIPARNEPDLDDLPADVLERLTVHPVTDVREVLELALMPATAAASGSDVGSETIAA